MKILSFLWGCLEDWPQNSDQLVLVLVLVLVFNTLSYLEAIKIQGIPLTQMLN